MLFLMISALLMIYYLHDLLSDYGKLHNTMYKILKKIS